MTHSHHAAQSPRVRRHPDEQRGDPSGVRRAVLICEDEDDLSPDVVGLLERAWARGLCLEVALVFDAGTLRMLTDRYPGAVLVRVRTDATIVRATTIIDSACLEVTGQDLEHPDTILETIEAALATARESDEAELPAPRRPGRRLLWTDAVTLADRLREAPRAKPDAAE